MSRSRPSDPGVKYSRTTNLRRSRESKDERWTGLILTNGKRTEVDYLSGLKREYAEQMSQVKILFSNGSPLDLVNKAVQFRAEFYFSRAWLVCDVDEFDIERTRASARKSDIAIAWSNPCFEVWLIIHLREGCPPLQGGSDAESKLREVLPTYDKNNLVFEDFAAHVLTAVTRAKVLGEAPVENPSTSVGILVEEVLSGAGSAS